MKSELLQRERFDFDDGTIVEMVIWRVPRAVTGSDHPFKYRLFFGKAGRRIGGREEPYAFRDVETLVRDFMADVERWRLK
jgi:hypothetical protein